MASNLRTRAKAWEIVASLFNTKENAILSEKKKKRTQLTAFFIFISKLYFMVCLRNAWFRERNREAKNLGIDFCERRVRREKEIP